MRQLRPFAAEESPVTRPARAIAGLLVVVLCVAVLALVAGPARGLRHDISAQRGLLVQQVAETRTLIELQRQQLAVSLQLRDTAARTDRRTAQLLELTRELDRKAGVTTGSVEQLRELAARLLVLAKQLEQHTASIDRKTGPTVP
jgi:hypothetical protein